MVDLAGAAVVRLTVVLRQVLSHLRHKHRQSDDRVLLDSRDVDVRIVFLVLPEVLSVRASACKAEGQTYRKPRTSPDFCKLPDCLSPRGPRFYNACTGLNGPSDAAFFSRIHAVPCHRFTLNTQNAFDSNAKPAETPVKTGNDGGPMFPNGSGERFVKTIHRTANRGITSGTTTLARELIVGAKMV